MIYTKKCFLYFAAFIFMLTANSSFAGGFLSTVAGIKTNTVVQLELQVNPIDNTSRPMQLDIIESVFDPNNRYGSTFYKQVVAVLTDTGYVNPNKVPNSSSDASNEKKSRTLYLEISPEALLQIEKNLRNADFGNRFVIDEEGFCDIPTATISYQPNRDDGKFPELFPIAKEKMIQTLFNPCIVFGTFPAADREMLAARNQLIDVVNDVLENGSNRPPVIIY